MSYTFEMRNIQPQATISIRVNTTRSAIGTTMGQALPQIVNYLQQLAIHPTGLPFARFHSFDADSVDMEAGFVLPDGSVIADSGQIVARGLPGGLVAVTWHIGPLDTFQQTYPALEAWIYEQGREPDGTPWEVYWTNQDQLPDPEQWRTEVLWPIK